MLLVVDIGNTNIVFGLYSGDNLVHKWRLSSDINKTANDYAIDLVELCLNHHVDFLQINGSIIASVVPSLTNKIYDAIKKLANNQLKIFVIGDGNTKINIDIALKNKNEIGHDRLVNAIAGYKKFGGNLAIVDFGTATTIDVVGGNGEYLGGIIACGVNLALKALHEQTAQLPKINNKVQKNVIGKNTIEALNSGSYFGTVALVSGLLNKIDVELNIATTKIITGGLAETFKDALKNNIHHHQPNLTLDGLKIIFQQQ